MCEQSERSGLTNYGEMERAGTLKTERKQQQ